MIQIIPIVESLPQWNLWSVQQQEEVHIKKQEEQCTVQSPKGFQIPPGIQKLFWKTYSQAR